MCLFILAIILSESAFIVGNQRARQVNSSP